MRAGRSVVALTVVALLAATWTAAAPAENQLLPDPARIAAARDLMAATGSARQFEAVMPMLMAQMEPLFLQMAPGKEQEVKDVLGLMQERFSKRKSELLEEIAKLYSEKMSAEDMQTLAKFFSDGAGARFIQMQPEIVQGSMLIGQKWGEQIGKELEAEVRQELQKRGIKI
jgi:uncharacterized protein